MAYVRHNWQNGTIPAINAQHLNEMEEGINEGANKIIISNVAPSDSQGENGQVWILVD